jgi:hypothetical protein
MPQQAFMQDQALPQPAASSSSSSSSGSSSLSIASLSPDRETMSRQAWLAKVETEARQARAAANPTLRNEAEPGMASQRGYIHKRN